MKPNDKLYKINIFIFIGNINNMANNKNKRRSPVYQHFVEDDNEFRCLLKTDDDEPCPNPIHAKSKSGGMASNLKRHLQRFHKKIAAEVEKAEAEAEAGPSASKKKTKTSGRGQQSLLGARFGWTSTSRKATVTVTADKFTESILKQVVYNGVALTHFTDDGFQLVCGDMAKELGIGIGREAVRNMVVQRFAQEKEALKVLLSGKFIYLKFDGATRLRKHFLGISVQFLNESGAIDGRTLALVDTKSKFDAASTKSLILNVLNDFDIKLENVLACAVDNASVMTVTLRLMDEDSVAAATAANMDNEGEEAGEGVDHGDEDGGNRDDEDDDDEDDEGFLTTLDLVAVDMGVKHMRCSEHSLQLAVRDGLKQPHAEEFLAKIRKVAANLRNPCRDEVLKRKARKAMLIDMPTRWGSTYLMIKRLVELKAHVKDFVHKDVELRPAQWSEVENLEKLLAIPYKATLALQSEQLTPGDCYLQWMEVEDQLEEMGGRIAEEMVSSLQKRRSDMLQNELFLGAVWIDSRSRILLSEAEQVEAKQFLASFAQRISDEEDSEPEIGNLFNYLFNIFGPRFALAKSGP